VPVVSILGAGPIGASVAHRLAQRGKLASIQVIDTAATVAAGKVLDMLQAAPVERFDQRMSTEGDELAAVSSPIVVLADDSSGGAWDGDRGLALVARLMRAGTRATFVFACPSQTWLMEKVYRELRIPADRLVGSAPGAVASAVRALAGLELGIASVQLAVCGRPPALVIGWAAATADGSLLTERVAPHRLASISARLPTLWPPRPYAIGSATAEVVGALATGARRLVPALTIVDDDLGVRGTAVMLPLELGQGRVLSRVIPSLSAQERTNMLRGLTLRADAENG